MIPNYVGMNKQFKREPLTEEESHKLIDACRDLKDKLIVIGLLDTGIRVSEFCAINKKNIIWQEKELRVYGKGGPFGKESKYRTVPFTERFKSLLQSWFGVHDEMSWKKPRGVQKRLKTIAKRTDIMRIVTPHVLRHTFSVLFHKKTGDLRALQLILGHDSISTTQIYLNYSTADIKDVYNRFEGVGK